MPMHILATGGLIVGGLLTAAKTYHAWKEGWDVPDTFQSCFTGYSWVHEDFKAERAVFTIPVVVGGVGTKLAIWTGYNQWTPKGTNL